MVENCIFACEFCMAKFNQKYLLTRHTKTSKKCLERRPKEPIFCFWCKEGFMSKMTLENHNCSVDKITAYISLQEKMKLMEDMYKSQIEEYKSQIKTLQDKINVSNTINNTNTNRNVYNVKLYCGKPLVLNKEKVENLMVNTLTTDLMSEGAYGLAKWFIKKVCVNENNEIAIECTDPSRMVFKYIDINDKITKITGEEILCLIKDCIPSLKQTDTFKKIYQKSMDEYGISNLSTLLLEVIRPDNKCIKYMCQFTNKTKLISLINNDPENIDSILDENVVIENKLEYMVDEE